MQKGKGEKPKRRRRFLRLALVFACVFGILLYISTVFFSPVAQRAGGDIGRLVDGSYYYRGRGSIWRFTPEHGRERARNQFGTLFVGSENIFLDETPMITLGETIFHFIYDNVLMGFVIYRGEETILPEGAILLESGRMNFGDNVIFSYLNKSEHHEIGNILATPDGELRELPIGMFWAGTNDFLLFTREESADGVPIYSYDLRSGEIREIYASIEVWQAVTDGVWLYTIVPWRGGRTDCWRLVFDENNTLVGLELIASDV